MKNCILAGALVLSACTQGVNAVQSYSDVPVQIFASGGERWQIYDKPEVGSLLVRASAQTSLTDEETLGSTTVPGAVPGEAAVFQTVASSYLQPRGCTVTSRRKLVGWNYEFTYSC